MYSRWMPPKCSTELYHHGIRGMKWGERHGPPYPLSQKTHNAVVKGGSPKTRNTGSATEYSGQRPKGGFSSFLRRKKTPEDPWAEMRKQVQEAKNKPVDPKEEMQRFNMQELYKNDRTYKRLADKMDKTENDYLDVAEDDFRPHDDAYKAELKKADAAREKAKQDFIAYRDQALDASDKLWDRADIIEKSNRSLSDSDHEELLRIKARYSNNPMKGLSELAAFEKRTGAKPPKEYESQSATVYGSQKKEKNEYDHSETAISKVGKWSWLGAKVAIDLMSLNPIGLAYDVRDAGTAIVGSAREMRFDSRTKRLETDSKTGLKIKDASKQWSPEEDMKAINPGYISRMSSGTKNNCVLCSLSYDLRRRGYDVAAGNATKGYNYLDLQHWYPGVKGTTVGRFNSDSMRKNAMANQFGIESKENRQKYIASSIDAIKKTGEGARGTLFVTWKGSTNGHALAYEVRNGEVHIYDCQNGKKQDPEKLLKQTSDSTAYRLDNLKPDPKYIKEVTRRK